MEVKTYKAYFNDGNTLSSECQRLNGLYHGYTRWYHGNNGIMTLEVYYIHGIQVGLETEYNKDGSIHEITTFKNSRPNGVNIWFSYKGKSRDGYYG